MAGRAASTGRRLSCRKTAMLFTKAEDARRILILNALSKPVPSSQTVAPTPLLKGSQP